MVKNGNKLINPAVIERIRQITGPLGYTTERQEIESFCVSWRDNWKGWVPIVAQPANVEELSAVVHICAETATRIVPQGGNTGLTGAGQPIGFGDEIIISTSRMNKIRLIDPLNDTMTVEAGCILKTIQDAAEEANRVFPLSLGAEGTCQIGGNLSTNAGGTQVLRYGNARNLVLGLEVVLPSGEVWNGLRGLRKDNTGYDLKQLFIGAEGTLGIISAAVLKLSPKPTDQQTAIAALPNPKSSLALLKRARETVGEQISGFELIQGSAMEMVLKHLPGTKKPFPTSYPWYVLMQVDGFKAPGSLTKVVENIFSESLDTRDVLDAVIAKSTSQANSLWKLREGIPEAQNKHGPSIKHDISIPVSRIPDFIEKAGEALRKEYQDIHIVSFGHVGDGNIHFNPCNPSDTKIFHNETTNINRIVHDIVARLDGSISAEHGIGQLRRKEIYEYKSAVEMDLMKTIKNALDPKNIFNPGKVF